jgi:16S rRNA processing protein RimM
MDYTIIGQITNTHGVKGELKVYPLTDDIKRFNILEDAYIGDEKIQLQVESVKYHKNLVILKFKEYNNINEVIDFKDYFIYVDEAGRIDLPKDHFFIYDILNSEVFDTDMNLIGTLIDVIQGSSSDVYVIKDHGNGKEYLIPAVKQFVKSVDIKEKKIYLDPIEGMLE